MRGTKPAGLFASVFASILTPVAAVALAAPCALAAGTADAAAQRAPAVAAPDAAKPDAGARATPPKRFVEHRGVREFRGVLVARPIQESDADRLGLTRRQVNAAIDGAIRELTAFDIERYSDATDEFLIKVPAGEDENSVAERLLATGDFAYVEPDWTVYPVGCPNDLNFSGQWHHAANRLGSCAAWDIETGSPSVVVAVCDTGVRVTHTDLRLNRREGFNVPAMKWEGAGGAVADVNGHGTRTTGCAAGNGNNAIGIAGAGWNLGHRMLRVTDSSTGAASLSSLVTAARTAADAGDRVVSVSFSGVGSSSTVQTTGTYVRSKGALLVWAAGNDALTLGATREDSVIVVGATDLNDALASFSNRGPMIDVVAPGVGVYTTSHTGDTSYASATGTSFACPLTAGVCGLIWSRNPTLTPAQVEAILRGTCRDLGAAGVDTLYGYGRIDAAAAVAATPLSGGGTDGGSTGGGSTGGGSTGGGSTGGGTGGGSGGGTGGTVVTLFSDGFESGTLSSGGWTVQNTQAIASTLARQAGAWGARLAGSTWVQRAVPTTGHTAITLTLARRTAGLDAGEALAVEWWNGSAWQSLGTTAATAWATQTFALPASAANLAGFRFRLRSAASDPGTERADIDGVVLKGTTM